MTDILDTIDNAITDYNVSGDAMRWTPEANAAEESARVVRLDNSNSRFVPHLPLRLFFSVAIQAKVDAFSKALIEAMRAVIQLIEIAQARPRRGSGPPPLPVDGNAYRRRVRNRRKK